MGGRGKRIVLVLGVLTGVVLAGIGVRFLVMPGAAAKFFGIDPAAPLPALHQAIGVRDLWLGGLAVALAAWRDWRALALWLALGSAVCFADAAIVAQSSGRWVSLVFHSASGVFCAGLAAAAWRAYRANKVP